MGFCSLVSDIGLEAPSFLSVHLTTSISIWIYPHMCSDFQSHWCISNLSHLRNINVEISYVIKAVLENDCFSFHCYAKVSKKIYLQRKNILPKFQTCFSMVNPWLHGLVISVPQWDRTAWSWTNGGHEKKEKAGPELSSALQRNCTSDCAAKFRLPTGHNPESHGKRVLVWKLSTGCAVGMFVEVVMITDWWRKPRPLWRAAPCSRHGPELY